MRAFLFSDLRGYTAYVERRGDAAAADLLGTYRDIVRAAVAAHEGAEIKTEGDSFYVVFDSPSAAVSCAISVQRALAAHESDGRERQLRVGIGLHAGETVPFDDQFVGSTVNVASRLASKAEADEIVVSDTLRGLVRTSLPLRLSDRGPLDLKGVSEPIHAWQVEWREESAEPARPARSVGQRLLPPIPPPRLAAPQGDIVCPSVVGREAERTRLLELLAATGSGRGRTLLVGGEAGVGKSAFVRQAGDAALEQGYRILYGPTVETDTGYPYAAFIAAVRSGFRGLEHDRLGSVLAQTAPALAQLFPELAVSGDRSDIAREEQHRISIAFHDLLSAFAREAPILLVLEDLHWADDASLDLLHYLARELRDARVLILATYRSDEMHRRHPFLRVLGAMQRERLLAEIQLKRLTREELAVLIQETLGLRDPATDELRDALFARSEGNPFFTEELLKALVEMGDIFRTPTGAWDRKPIEALRIPGSIREAVRDRIEGLSSEAQESLSAASVIGHRFSFEVLRDVLGIDDEALLVHLKQFVDQQLVGEAGESDMYAFRHALTREVVYEELLIPERKVLHRKVAAALSARTLTQPSLLATHLIAAGDNAGAVPHLLAAAEDARRAYAPREAVAHLERALELGGVAGQQAAILEAIAEAAFLFDATRAVKVGESAAAAYLEQADPLGASRALVVASRALLMSMRTHAERERAAALAERAVRILDGLADSGELAWALTHLAAMRVLAFEIREAAVIARRAIELGERLGHPRATANAYVTLANATWFDDPSAAWPALVRGRDLAVAHGYTDVAWRAYIAAPTIGLTAGRTIDQFRVAAEEAVAYAQVHGLERAVSHDTAAFGDYLAGEWDAAISREGRSDQSKRIMSRSIAMGRESPETVRPLLEAARAGLVTEDAFYLGEVAGLARGFTRCRDRDTVVELLATIDDGLASGREPYLLATWLVQGILLGALFLDDATWIARLREIFTRGMGTEFIDGWLALYDGATALMSGDAGAAASKVRRFVELVGPIAPVTALDMTVDFAREADFRGLDSTAFAASLEAVRPTAERARASWLLGEIDRLARTANVA